MTLDEAPVLDQLAAFEAMIRRNPAVTAILDRMPRLDLPDCWLAAGGLVQTVWNLLSDRDPRAGILDYDVNYFDASDLSWEAEDRAITAATAAFDGIEARIEIRNQARVHLWYEANFGAPCPPYRSTRHAITTFPSCCSCVAVRPKQGRLEVYAPFGLTDLFRMTARPNPVLAPARIYRAKTERWTRQWPQLTVLPWPSVES
jgi:uncharacterized protein